MSDSDSLDAMRKLAARLEELEERRRGDPPGAIALDDAVRDFAVRVQRLARELADLRGMLEGIGQRRPPPQG
jgi:hypothetical protein